MLNLPVSLVTGVRRVWRILPESDRRGWIVVTALGLLFALLEASTALAVLYVVAALTPSTMVTGGLLNYFETARLTLAPGISATSFAALALLTIVTLSLATNIAHLYLEGRLATRAYVWAGVKLLRAYLRGDYVWFHQQNSADFIRSIQESANVFSTYVLVSSSRICRETMTFLAVCVTGLASRPELASIAALFIVIYVLIHWLPARLAARLGRASERIKRDQQQSLQEAFEFFDEARINGLTEVYVERFARPRQEYRRILVFRQLNDIIPPRCAEWIVLAFLVIAILVIGESLQGSALRDYWTQTLVFALYLAYRLRSNLSALLGHVVTLRFGWASFGNVERGIATPVGFDDKSIQQVNFNEVLRLEDVSFVYPNGDGGIRHVTLEIKRGEWIGLAGRSGAGKTTLAAVIMGLIRPQSGQIVVDNRPIHLDQLGWYRRLGYVSQRIALLDDSLRANIVLHSEVPCDEQRLHRVIELAQLDQLVAALPDGLDSRIGERGSLLSGGQRQRVALARAMYREADLLILDEATSALDVETENAIINSLEKLRGKVTLIAISHRETVLGRCDRVVWLDESRLLTCEKRSQLPEPVAGA
jgi:ABC-type multidrug transport system fused ATPase/permease subunit